MQYWVVKDDAAAKDDANGKTVPSKSGGSAGRGMAGNSDIPDRRGKGKNRGGQTELPLKPNHGAAGARPATPTRM